MYSCLFAGYIKGANIEYCQKATYKDSRWAKRFAEDIFCVDQKKYKIYSIL